MKSALSSRALNVIQPALRLKMDSGTSLVLALLAIIMPQLEYFLAAVVLLLIADLTVGIYQLERANRQYFLKTLDDTNPESVGAWFDFKKVGYKLRKRPRMVSWWWTLTEDLLAVLIFANQGLALPLVLMLMTAIMTWAFNFALNILTKD